MKVCIIGKYPPIQGGVSMRTFWAAHNLARLGHTVHVMTNAKEVTAPHRMLMREEDWARCDARYEVGSVEVHWTEPYGERQAHVPPGTPFVSKLASIGLELEREKQIDIIYSHYTEPYAIAAHMVAQLTGVPHVTRTAGSDAGRLWSLPQFTHLYDQVFAAADAVICSPTVAKRMIKAGVSPMRLARDSESVRLDQIFSPDGPILDLEVLHREVMSLGDFGLQDTTFGEFNPALAYLGIYGKMGRTKGTYALLQALKKLKDTGVPLGVLALAHESDGDGDFRRKVVALDLQDRVCQIPFLPHWRVPEFIRRCIAICCLEQDFPIKFHTPVVAREVLTCGGCLVASVELVQKLPSAHKLADGYNCIAIKDVKDTDALARRLRSVYDQLDRIDVLRHRARDYGVALDRDNEFPRKLERIFRDIRDFGQLSQESMRPIEPNDLTTNTYRLRKRHAGILPAQPTAVPKPEADFVRLSGVLGRLNFKSRMAVLDAIASKVDGFGGREVVEALKMDILALEKRVRKKMQAGSDNKGPPPVFRFSQAAGFFDEAQFDTMIPRLCEQYGFINVPGALANTDPLVTESAAYKRLKSQGYNGPADGFCAVVPERSSHTIRIVDDLDAALLKACNGSKSVNQVCEDAANPTLSTGELRERMLRLFRIGLIKLSNGRDMPLIAEA
jgi:Glycosyl transferase 4-like domain